jgi:regulator of sigma E protease
VSVILLIVSLILFGGLILGHEWGHFLLARRNGVEAEEFALFFGPAIYKHRTKAGWLFRINLFPLGGYVKLKGEHDTDTEPGSFGAASLWAKSKIMAAGVVMNLIIAFILFTFLALIGMPKLVPNQFTVKSNTKVTTQEVIIGYVEPGSPAAKAGLKPEDRLLGIAAIGQSSPRITTAAALPAVTKQLAGQRVNVTYAEDGKDHTTQTTLLTAKVVNASQKTNNPKGYLGISPTDFTLQRSTWSTPIVAIGFGAQVTALTYQGLGHALAGLGSLIAGGVTHNTVARQNGQTNATSEVSGPIGIYYVLKDGSILGYQFMLFIIAIISLTLAIMNILPIPALDGGRLWITLIAHGLKRPLSPHREEIINATGFVVLLTLIVLVSIVDVHRFG